jgi:hypothetical protein
MAGVTSGGLWATAAGGTPPAAGGSGGRRVLRVSGCLGSGFQSPAVLEVGQGGGGPTVAAGCGRRGWAAVASPAGWWRTPGGRCQRRGSVIGATRAGCGRSGEVGSYAYGQQNPVGATMVLQRRR